VQDPSQMIKGDDSRTIKIEWVSEREVRKVCMARQGFSNTHKHTHTHTHTLFSLSSTAACHTHMHTHMHVYIHPLMSGRLGARACVNLAWIAWHTHARTHSPTYE